MEREPNLIDSQHRLVLAGSGQAAVALIGGETLVGRSLDCSVRLANPRASRRHACITVRDGAAFLSDLGSSNGTLVNDASVRGTIELRDGDQISFAGELATYRTPAQAKSTQPAGSWDDTRQLASLPRLTQSTADQEAISPPLPTAASAADTPPESAPPDAASPTDTPPEPAAPPVASAAVTPEPTPPPAASATVTAPEPAPPAAASAADIPPEPASLPVVSAAGIPPESPPSNTDLVPSQGTPGQSEDPSAGPSAALERPGGQPVLLMKAETRIGRAEQNDVALEDGRVSAKHAMIVQQADQFMLIDLGSANGTYVNEELITGPVVLEPGDAVRFGESGFVFRRLMLVTKRRLKGAPRPPGVPPGKRPT